MAYPATKLRITSLEVIANSDTVLITGVKPWFEYENNRRTDKQLGHTYEVVMPEAAYDKFDIKVPGSKAQFKQDDIEDSSGGIKVRPLNFEAGFYNTDRGSLLTARASGFEAVKI